MHGRVVERRAARDGSGAGQPALRCQQTALALRRRFKTHEGLGPHSGAAELLRLAGWPVKRVPLLVVGHQPTLGQVAAALMTGAQPGLDAGAQPALDAGASPSWSVKKGAVWWLRGREREGSDEVVLLAVRSADRL